MTKNTIFRASVTRYSLALVVATLLLFSVIASQSLRLFLVVLSDSNIYDPETVVIQPRNFEYRTNGEFFKDTQMIDPPMVRVIEKNVLEIMKYQVSWDEYSKCVGDQACDQSDAVTPLSGNVPVTGVNFDDATAYAEWLSKKTGVDWVLPTDQQLAFAAGRSFPDDALGIDPENKNPALRWLAKYKRDADSKHPRDPTPMPLGSFGTNEFGLADFGGNIWEWTTTCYQKFQLKHFDPNHQTIADCGVYMAVGDSRSPMSWFVRNPKGGGCSTRSPPTNLGFRLVKKK